MQAGELFASRAKVHVSLSGKYLPAVVVSSRLWSHSSGNEYRAYRVRLRSGFEFECSANSIREFAEPVAARR